MSFLNSLERKGLFVLTRGLALLVVLGLAVGVVVALWSVTIGGEPLPDGRVDPQKAIKAMVALKKGEVVPPETAAQRGASEDGGIGEATIPGASDPLAGLKLPTHKRFSDWMENEILRKMIREWILEVPRKDRQAFVDGIGAFIPEAEKAEKEGINMGEAMMAYVDTCRVAREDAKAALEARKAKRERALYGVTAGLALMALFSLVLVLLAIERNTRPSAS